MKLKATFTVLAIACLPQAVLAQSAQEITVLLKTASLGSASHDVQVTASNGQINISTYCGAGANDNDCRATALLMLREIAHRYSSVDHIRVFFFDRLSPSSYRQITIARAVLTQVEQGTPVSQVLAGVPVTRGGAHGGAGSGYRFSVSGVKPGPYFEQRQELANSIQSLIDQGGDAGDTTIQFGKLEAYCLQPKPSRYTAAALYNKIAADVHRRRLATVKSPSPAKMQADMQAHLDKQMTAVRQSVEKKLNDGERDVPTLLKTIQDTVVNQQKR